MEYGNKLANNFLEFGDLGSAIMSMGEILLGSNVASMPEREIPKLITMLDMFGDDIRRWRQNIFVDALAADIHYLDDSLLSSIEQIRRIFTQEKDSEEEELELF